MSIETVKVLYTATGTAEGGRNGTTLSGDGLVDVNLSVPKAMGGPGKAGASTPEDLFAAGYAACFGGAVEFMGVKNNLKAESVKVESAVGIGTTESGMGLKVDLTVTVKGLSQADAEKIVALGHAFCPYSKAIKGNVDVSIKTVVA
ncbi:MAG: Ohr family peroxiredoxin [Stagnimonas sp.]|nr:Ohr family peroxiredoxin [Stagnimonas sp.]